MLKALGWIWAIWLIVSLVSQGSRFLLAVKVFQFVLGDRYSPLLENSRSGKRCIAKRFLTTYGSLTLANFGLFWLCFQNFFPGGWQIPMIRPVFNMVIISVGVLSIMQTAAIMIMSSSVEAQLAEHDPDADSW